MLAEALTELFHNYSLVLLLAGVFSESTARALSYYSTIYPDFAGTGNFVTFINKLWKVMSLKTPSKGMKCCKIHSHNTT